jgi:glycosyltransferase involved in cell wall biosynthesis
MRLRVVVSERNDPRAHGVGRAWTLLRRLAYPFTDALVVQSAVFVPWARAATLGQRQVEVIPNPAPEVPIHRLSEDRSAHTIVAIGRLVPQKGFDVLLTAFARIADEFPSWNLTIAGEGKERSRLCDLAATLGITARVTLAGWIPEPGNLLAKATFFVMSSRYEGFPNALVEAISYGVPVISTSWAGAAEIITDGVDGLLVPVTSPESLAMSMRRLMSDPELRNRLRRNASAVSHRYDIRAVVERWDAVLAPPEGRMPAASEHRPDAGS